MILLIDYFKHLQMIVSQHKMIFILITVNLYRFAEFRASTKKNFDCFHLNKQIY